MTAPAAGHGPRNERTFRRGRGRPRTLRRRDVASHRELEDTRHPADAKDRGPEDREPLLGPCLGSPCGRNHPEHVRDDLHRGEHSSLWSHHHPGRACPHPGRVRRRVRARRHRHLRHQGRLALRARHRRCSHRERATVEIPARGGVVPRRSPHHPRSRPSQGRRGNRSPNSPGSGSCSKEPGTRSRSHSWSPRS